MSEILNSPSLFLVLAAQMVWATPAIASAMCFALFETHLSEPGD
jgi:hypothetical protein